MVDAESGGYREKYRRAIEEQERLEKQFKFQLEALRKTLLHVCATAQGLDSKLDGSIALLKEKMRGASGQHVIEQMEKVQKAAQEYEHSRHAAGLKSAKQIIEIIEQLQNLKLPGSLKSTLSNFEKNLTKRLSAVSSYPDILSEFKNLHAMAMEAATNPPQSFLQRLRGGKTLKKFGEADASEPLRPLEGEFEEVEETEISPQAGEFILAGEAGEQEAATRFEPGDEENYHQVADRIARTLENLVERIEPNDVVRHKIDIVRLRIQRGMDWYVLAVTLEDIRDILLLRYLQNDQDFSDYLKRVNDELHSISTTLGLVSDQEKAQREISDRFSNAVSDQVSRMQKNMEKSATIDDLKLAVTDHLTEIQSAIKNYKTEQSEQTSITEQLKSLISRVAQIEDESEKTKAQLEAEHHRATHDTLTGLPNREAYNERAFAELQRFKRYCRPLTLAVCDIDLFKKVNDSYGHQTGDKVLRLIAQLVSTRLRSVDFVARFGGEEFVLLLPETSPDQALLVLEKIRKVVAKTPFKFKGDPVKITLSFGLASFSAEDNVEDVFERADKALYQAKKNGRNQSVVAENPSE